MYYVSKVLAHIHRIKEVQSIFQNNKRIMKKLEIILDRNLKMI